MRPRFLIAALTLAAAGAASGADAQEKVRPAADPEPRTFEIQRVGERVHAATVVDRPHHYAFASSLIVVGDSGVLIVDTQQSPAAARALIASLPDITRRPVRWVVNTHWHPDHVYGNVAWKEAFPDAVVIGHRSLIRDVPDRAGAMRDDELASLPASIDDRRGWLDQGHRDGVTLDSAGRAAIAYSLDLRQRYLEQLRDLTLVPPDRPVDDSLVIDLGGIHVRILHLGPAHTRGDLVVHVPDAGVVATGDLLEAATPWLAGACISGWARALRRIQRLRPHTLLLSHGGLAETSLLDLYTDLLHAIAAGHPLEPFRERLATIGVPNAAFDRFVAAVPAARDAAAEACESQP